MGNSNVSLKDYLPRMIASISLVLVSVFRLALVPQWAGSHQVTACLTAPVITQTGPHMPTPIVKSLQNSFSVLEIFCRLS